VSLGANAGLLARDYEASARDIVRSQETPVGACLPNLLNVP